VWEVKQSEESKIGAGVESSGVGGGNQIEQREVSWVSIDEEGGAELVIVRIESIHLGHHHHHHHHHLSIHASSSHPKFKEVRSQSRQR
jgi:hypothetical protein